MEFSADLLVVRNFFIALMIGALVGVEREKRKTQKDEISFGGLRTFILFAEAGAISAWLSLQLASPWLFILTVVAVSLVVTMGYVLGSHVKPDSLGLTTELAAITVCLLGGAVMYGYAEVAVGLGIVTASVLAFKQPLHGIVEKLGMDDIYAALKLLIATFVVLPILPHRTLDPWGALDPYELWLLVILISSLSLVGYVAVRWLGRARGTLVTGLTGGLASSTAVTVSFARESRLATPADPQASSVDALAAGILVSWVVMFVRILVAVSFVHAGLVRPIAPACASMAGVAAIGTTWFYVRHARTGRSDEAVPSDVPLKNPFSLLAAIRFCAVFAVVLLLVRFADLQFAASGMYAVAALAGLTDVDAITLTMARSARSGGETAVVAAGAVVIAAIANTIAKYGMIAVLGSAALRSRMLLPVVALVAAGVVALALG